MSKIAVGALVAVVSFATACGSKTGTAEELPDPSSFACSSDSDCVVSCLYYDKSCCADPCGEPCDDVYHKDALAALEKWRAAHCEKGCDIIGLPDCSASGNPVEAVCVDRVCKAERASATPPVP